MDENFCTRLYSQMEGRKFSEWSTRQVPGSFCLLPVMQSDNPVITGFSVLITRLSLELGH